MNMSTIYVNIPEHDYEIVIKSGILSEIGKECDLNRRVLVVTDKGVPREYAETVASQAKKPVIAVIDGGEEGKTLDTFAQLQQFMLDNSFSRKDCVVAVGGGVVGDIAAFAASCYMRGIDFYNVPTTVLSQVDSSIGGKTGVDLEDTKNIIGAFWQPAAVIIDPDVLSTLPERQMNAGLAEAVKAGIIRDPELFAIFEGPDARNRSEEIIYRALKVKKDIVEADERESGERKLLNFGHTFGHAYESYYGLGRYLHGECVAMGMMTVIDDPELKERLRAVLEKLGLPTHCDADPDRIMELMRSDKKADHGVIDLVMADEPGKGYIKSTDLEELRGRLG